MVDDNGDAELSVEVQTKIHLTFRRLNVISLEQVSKCCEMLDDIYAGKVVVVPAKMPND
jgi:hypothetical protein